MQLFLQHWCVLSEVCSGKLNITSHFKLPAEDPELVWNHPHKASMSGTGRVSLHRRLRQSNLSAVPNSCNAATHSTRLRERDHEHGSWQRAPLQRRTAHAHNTSPLSGRMREVYMVHAPKDPPIHVQYGTSILPSLCLWYPGLPKQLTKMYNTQVLRRIWQWTKITKNNHSTPHWEKSQ